MSQPYSCAKVLLLTARSQPARLIVQLARPSSFPSTSCALAPGQLRPLLAGVQVRGLATKPPNSVYEIHKPSYRPGSDSYAYENPWPKLNRGRFDWLFQDGWRRPLHREQGAKIRREWIPFGVDVQDEHRDWFYFHRWWFGSVGFLLSFLSAFVLIFYPDWPNGRDWAQREAYLELSRREAAGLPLVSKDYIEPQRVIAALPSDEELGNTVIII